MRSPSTSGTTAIGWLAWPVADVPHSTIAGWRTSRTASRRITPGFGSGSVMDGGGPSRDHVDVLVRALVLSAAGRRQLKRPSHGRFVVHSRRLGRGALLLHRAPERLRLPL